MKIKDLDIRAQVSAILEKLEEKAEKLDYWMTTIFFINRINGDLESRTVFAEHQMDASQIAWDWKEQFKKNGFKFYILSTAYDSNYDGGLYD